MDRISKRLLPIGPTITGQSRQPRGRANSAFWGSLATIVLCLATPLASAQVTSNVFRRVLMVQVGSATATSFTIDVDGRQYLVTAKHVVAKLKAEDSISVSTNDLWTPVKVKVFRCADPIDIAVLVPPTQLTVSFALDPTMVGMRYAQDVYFAGFPYGLSMEGKTVNGLYPVAFVKKAIVSAIANESGVIKIFLDGHNNPGFSGGPIVYRDLDRSDLT